MARYEELLQQLPRGSAYANEGYVLPFRDAPQEFLFEDTTYPSQDYGIFVDNQFRGTVTSDAAGSVVVSAILAPGAHEVTIENDFNARRLTAYVTVRDYAVWYAAYAEVLEGSSTFFGIDPAIDSVENASALSTADRLHIEEVHGRLLRQPNDLGYITDAYRTVLQGMRQAFRYYAAMPEGLAQVAASFTNARAYLAPAAFRPRWVLDDQFAPNNLLDLRTHVVASALPTLNAQSLAAVATVPAASLTVAPTANVPTTAQALIVTFTSTWNGGNITVTGTNPSGVVVSEVFTPTGTAIGGFIYRTGSELFATVTAVDNSVMGSVGTATIGLTASAYVRVVDVEGSPIREGTTTAGTTYLTLNNNAGALSLSYGNALAGNNDNAVLVPVSGRYTIPYNARGERLLGEITPAAGYDFSDGAGERGRDRLYLEVGDRGPITVVLGATGTLNANALANVVADIDAALTADSRYGTGCASSGSSTSLFTGTQLILDSSLIPFVGDAQRSRVRLQLGCADASREVLGLPHLVGDAQLAGTTGATSVSYMPGDTIGNVAAPFQARVGRGLLGTGSGTVSNASGRFADFAGSATALRVGECVRLESTTGANAGLHTVTEVLSGSSWRLRHESVTGTFTNAGSQAYQAWVLGDIVEVTVNNTATNQLTIATPGLPRDLPSGFQIELANEMPFQTDANHRDTPSNLVVDIDTTLAPTVGTGSSVADTLALAGQVVPDGWLVSSGTAVAQHPTGLVSDSSAAIERGASDIQFEAVVDRVVPELRGFPMRASFWVQQHNTAASQNFRVDVSYDGTNFVTGATVPVTGTLELDGANRETRPRPSLVQQTFTPPRSATTLVVRLVHVGTAAGERITVERATVTSDITSGFFLASNTIVRGAQESNFGELLYLWSPEDLSAAENQSIGIDTTLPRPLVTGNKIDLVSPAHSTVSRFDVSEYTSGVPVNVLGAYNDVGWLAAARTNLDVVIAVPGRLSYLRPARVSRVVGEALSPDAFGVATLANPTTHLGPFTQVPNGTTQLFEDGLSFPDTPTAAAVQPYAFTAGDRIDIDNGLYQSAAAYTLDYDVLMSAETAVIDLGSSATDYLWLVDAYVWRAIEQTLGSRTTITQVAFLADFTATLSVPSNQDQNTTVLTADNGVTRTVVPAASYNYVDQNTISVDSAVFDANSLYSVEYQSVFAQTARQPTFTVEVRSAATQALVPSATYSSTFVDDIIDNTLQFHQLRISLFGVENAADVRVHSLGLRGLRIFGTAPNAPGIVLP